MVSSKVLGERIAFLRRRRGLTQSQLAERLGVARTTLVAIESGERRVDSNEIIAIARALDARVHELARPNLATAGAAPRFRLAARGEVAEAELGQGVSLLEELGRAYLELESLSGIPMRASPLDVIAASQLERMEPRSSGEQAANQVRSALGLGDGPIPDLDAELGAAGVRIFHLPLANRIAGIFLWGDEIGACVAVNAKHPSARRRFSLAHELGHAIRDREAGDVYFGEEDRKDPSEVFADSFAKELLLPRSNVLATFHSFVRGNAGRFSPSDIIAMSQVYGVSFQATALRLEELGLLPRGTYSQLIERRFKPEETAQTLGLVSKRDPPRELPDRYVALAVKAFEDELLAEGDLARYLRVDRVTARGIVRTRRTQALDTGEQVEVDLGRDLLGK